MQFRCSVPLGFRVALWKSRPCFAWLRRRGIQAVLLRGAVSDLDGVGSILCFLLLGYSPIRFRGSHRSSGSVCRVFCRHVQRALRWWHILSPGIVSGWARQLVRSFSSLFFGPLRSGQAARPMRASQAGFRVGLLSGQLRAFRCSPALSVLVTTQHSGSSPAVVDTVSRSGSRLLAQRRDALRSSYSTSTRLRWAAGVLGDREITY